MSIKDFILREISKSKLIEKFYIFDSVKINYLLNSEADIIEAQKLIHEIQTALKKYVPNMKIESAIVTDAEKDEIKEISYVQ